jgi:hypothetical protein
VRALGVGGAGGTTGVDGGGGGGVVEPPPAGGDIHIDVDGDGEGGPPAATGAGGKGGGAGSVKRAADDWPIDTAAATALSNVEDIAFASASPWARNSSSRRRAASRAT